LGLTLNSKKWVNGFGFQPKPIKEIKRSSSSSYCCCCDLGWPAGQRSWPTTPAAPAGGGPGHRRRWVGQSEGEKRERERKRKRERERLLQNREEKEKKKEKKKKKKRGEVAAVAPAGGARHRRRLGRGSAPDVGASGAWPGSPEVEPAVGGDRPWRENIWVRERERVLGGKWREKM